MVNNTAYRILHISWFLMQYVICSMQYSALSTALARSIAQPANGCQGLTGAQAVELMAAMVRYGHTTG